MDRFELSPKESVFLDAKKFLAHSFSMHISSPRELIAAIPHLLGFHPANSIVLVAFDDTEIVGAIRADLDVVREAMVSPLVNVVNECDDPYLAIVYYCDKPTETTDWQEALDGTFAVPVLDVLQVTESAWRSLLCSDASCCPAEGNAIDRNITALDTAFVANGSAPLDSREELVSTFQTRPLNDDDITERAIAFSKTRTSECAAELAWTINALIHDDFAEWNNVARVSQALCDFRIRDGLLRASYDTPSLRWFVKSRLREVLQKVDDSFVPALATVVAGCAWLDGNGVLANVAITRALECDPTYSLAQLLDRALTHGVPPHVWAESLAAVSPEKCLAGAA